MPTAPHVALFATCITDTMKPSIPIATVQLLERLGCKVSYPASQTCCGQIMTNTGYFKEALPTVRNYVKSFGEYDYIVAPSGSCVGSVREQHAMLAEKSGDKALQADATAVAGRTYELTEFLVDVLGVTDVGAYFPHRVTYHPTCHSMRITKVGDRPLQLLRAVRGIDLVELPMAEQCCGFGGTFSMKNPDVSIAMASDKARHVRSTDAEYLVAGDHACLMNIGGVLHRQRSGIRTIHIAEILASTEKEVAVA
ncbi:L-lactate dehydrogenase complex protein LldE [Tessaracoccus bendigoensis DSM 12906]|uniref:L-lactate dehydrogenase complex protein LldE n=1 Tax=Tessaracoccus bendigoensis DSM 12906 TaxID=1123357 RepID=A0A1M6AK52_9ACTN|nr:(Fe-S)-binding protein [Tessaracoccus bendigoensis]SHI36718.1 L-lactate dehydrogenase complex protein LldE [Tessaracoccus bendigoensis DSM 12906]